MHPARQRCTPELFEILLVSEIRQLTIPRFLYDNLVISRVATEFSRLTASSSASAERDSDSDVISMLAGFLRHLVGKTLINVFTAISLKYALLAS